jgi:hypothetical protein
VSVPVPVPRPPAASPQPSAFGDDLAFATALVVTAGRLLMDRYERVERVDYKSARDIVTEVDHLSEELIIDAIGRAFRATRSSPRSRANTRR